MTPSSSASSRISATSVLTCAFQKATPIIQHDKCGHRTQCPGRIPEITWHEEIRTIPKHASEGAVTHRSQVMVEATTRHGRRRGKETWVAESDLDEGHVEVSRCNLPQLGVQSTAARAPWCKEIDDNERRLLLAASQGSCVLLARVHCSHILSTLHLPPVRCSVLTAQRFQEWCAHRRKDVVMCIMAACRAGRWSLDDVSFATQWRYSHDLSVSVLRTRSCWLLAKLRHRISAVHAWARKRHPDLRCS